MCFDTYGSKSASTRRFLLRYPSERIVNTRSNGLTSCFSFLTCMSLSYYVMCILMIYLLNTCLFEFKHLHFKCVIPCKLVWFGFAVLSSSFTIFFTKLASLQIFMKEQFWLWGKNRVVKCKGVSVRVWLD